MRGLRNLCRRNVAAALLIVAFALAVRALVPTGYMASASPTGLTVELCSGVSGKSMTIALPGTNKGAEHGKMQADSPCAFSALGLAGAPATDPILLASAILFILALGFAAVAIPTLRHRSQLRPPLRGPPLEA